jgi:dihydrofolate reductase
MRKIILQLTVSLDGFIEGPNGEYDWCFTDQDYGLLELFQRIDAVFFGRKTYEMMLNVADQNDSWLPQLKEYIFSNTIDKVKAGANLVRTWVWLMKFLWQFIRYCWERANHYFII